jgi:hypothetical protein
MPKLAIHPIRAYSPKFEPGIPQHGHDRFIRRKVKMGSETFAAQHGAQVDAKTCNSSDSG